MAMATTLWVCSLLLVYSACTPAAVHAHSGPSRFAVHRHAGADHHHHHHHHHRRLTAAIKKGARPGAADGGRSRCGAPAADAAQQAQFNYLVKVQTRDEVLAATPTPPFAVTVPVVFHVVHAEQQGWVDEAVLRRQVEVVNDAYNGTGFSFELRNVTYTDNATWHTINGSEDYSDNEMGMKRALRVGGSETLNVLIVNLAGFLGKAEFPYRTMTNPESKWLVWDGILLNYEALPDGPLPLFNIGHTLTHEIGHWLNLLHTFEGGCVQGNRGDFISDTAAEAEPNKNTCDVQRDSCKGLRFPGRDPILNFMDYSPDQCYKEFSPMQVNRMQKAWTILRTAKG